MRFTSIRVLLAVAGLAVVLTHGARAQPGAKNVSVKLNDGSTIYGRLEHQGTDSVVIVGAAGRSAFSMRDVRDVRDAGEAHKNDDGTTEYWFPNANATRMLFGPTGRTLDAGEGYFADHEVMLGSVNFGVTDRFSLGGGGVLIPSAQTWFITPKVALVRGPNLNVAIGALFGEAGGTNAGGIGYVAATLGAPDRSLTLGVGNQFSGGGNVVMAGGEYRLSRRISLITENYVFSGGDRPLVSYGIRILGEKTSVDLAFISASGSSATTFPGIPYVDFVIRF